MFAYGRDPYFSGWPDTLQLDYSARATQRAMAAELAKIAGQCDGVRCDMAMLVLPDVFQRTWGRRPEPFWSRVIPEVREQASWFLLHGGGLLGPRVDDAARGVRLRLRQAAVRSSAEKHARPVRDHFRAGLDYQDRLARFLENHDEPRAAATFDRDVREAAAIVSFLSPGLRFFHQGQFEGRLKRISPHLVRAPHEPEDDSVRRFYERLLSVLGRAVVRHGQWQLLECVPAWDGNGTSDGFLAFGWQLADREHLLVTVNYAATQGQCYVRLPLAGPTGRTVRFVDLMSEARYDRDRGDLASRGLYLDMPPWGYHVFEVSFS